MSFNVTPTLYIFYNHISDQEWFVELERRFVEVDIGDDIPYYYSCYDIPYYYLCNLSMFCDFILIKPSVFNKKETKYYLCTSK